MFIKGKSGNPAGRRPGSKNRATIIQERLAKDAAAIMDVMVAKAKAGDVDCARFLLSRLLPAAKDLPVAVPSTGTLSERGARILDVMLAGKITAGDAVELIRALGAQATLVDHVELARRIETIEARLADAQDADP